MTQQKGQFRFDMDQEGKDVVERALSFSRVLHCDEDPFKARSWKGSALREVSQFYLNSFPDVQECLDEQDAAVQEMKQEAERESRKFTPKIESRIRQEVRERWKERKEVLRKKEFAAVVRDNDRLYKALLLAGTQYLCDCHRDGTDREEFTVFEPDAVQTGIRRWKNRGGFLLRVRGDSRTLTERDGRPTFYLYMKEDIEFPIHEQYLRLFDDIENPEIELAEVIPHSGANWDAPSIATTRLKLKE